MREAFDLIDEGKGALAEARLLNPSVQAWVEPELGQIKPLHQQPLPPLVRALAEYFLRCGRVPQPELAHAAALSVLGTLYGGRFKLETGARPNLFIIATAHTGQGKDAARNGAVNILDACGAGTYYGGESFASSAAVFSVFADDPYQRPKLFLTDEFGDMLGLTRSQSAASYVAGLPKVLKEAFGWSSRRAVLRPARATANKDDESSNRLIRPHLNIYATTVPSSMYAALSGSDVVDGLLNRFLVFEGVSEIQPTAALVQDGIPLELQSHMTDLADWAKSPDWGYGVDSFALGAEARAVGLTDDARAEFERLDRWVVETRSAGAEAQDASEALLARTVEKANKLALILQLADAGVDAFETVEVGGGWARVACLVARRQDELIMHRARARIGDTAWAQVQARVLARVRDAGPGGIGWRKLMRGLHMRAKDLKEHLEALHEAGDIMVLGGPKHQRSSFLAVG